MKDQRQILARRPDLLAAIVKRLKPENLNLPCPAMSSLPLPIDQLIQATSTHCGSGCTMHQLAHSPGALEPCCYHCTALQQQFYRDIIICGRPQKNKKKVQHAWHILHCHSLLSVSAQPISLFIRQNFFCTSSSAQDSLLAQCSGENY